MNLVWVCVYDDQSNFHQYNEDGSENKYSDIDRERLSEFHMIDEETGRTVYALALDEGQRLIYRKRVSMSSVTGKAEWMMHMVGWQQTVNGTNVQSISWIMEDGSVIQTGKFRDGHRIFYGVETFDWEDVSKRPDAEVEQEQEAAQKELEASTEA